METIKRTSITVPSSIMNIKEMRRKGYLFTWLHILMCCEVTNQTLQIGGQTVTRKLGVFETSYAKLADIAKGNTPNWTKTFLRVLMVNRLAGVRKEKMKTLIAIPNFDFYLSTNVMQNK